MDKAAYEATTRTVGKMIVPLAKARKMERERNQARLIQLESSFREMVMCGWCRDMMHAPPGFVPPMTPEKRETMVRLHLLECPKHPIRETERELEELREQARLTIMENLHLADGDVCTLKRLKDAIGFMMPPENAQSEAAAPAP